MDNEILTTEVGAKNFAVLASWHYENDEATMTSYIMVVDSSTETGEKIHEYLNSDGTQEDYAQLNRVLKEHFDLTDEQIVFYIVDDGIKTYEDISREVYNSNDMVIEEFVQPLDYFMVVDSDEEDS